MAAGSGNSFSGISLSLNRNLQSAQNKLSDSFQKLSSGLRINRAADDAAGLAVAESLNASIVTLGQASRNVGDLTSFTQIADGALGQISDLSTRKAELAAQSANGTLSDAQRSTLALEDSQLTQEIGRIVETTQFNGVSVFKGNSTSGQVGTDSSANSQLAVGGIDVSTLVSAISSQNISTQAGARASLDAVTSFTASIAQQRGTIGATQSRLDSISDTVETRKLNESQALSRIRDLDVADEVSKKISADILSQTGPALLAQAAKLSLSNIKALLS